MSEDSENSATVLERVWAWLHRTFPERQIYIRSDGRVQFFTFGPSLQATLAGLVLIFLGWVAFATVNVVFKDRIIAAKDHRFQQMQSAYENRLADLQISYDELNGALVGAEDKFKATADALTVKQNAIAGFLSRKTEVESAIGARAADSDTISSGPALDRGVASDSVGFSGAIPADGEEAPDSSLTVLPGPVTAQPRVEIPSKASLLNNTWKKVEKIASALFDRRARAAPEMRVAYAQHPALQKLAEQTARVAALGNGETDLMSQTEVALNGDVGLLRSAVKRTGIDPDKFLRKAAASEGVGGPEIPLEAVHIEGIADAPFNQEYLRAGAVLNELDTLTSEMSHIPFTMPVAGAAFDRSSGFGARVDPFTGRYAFHPGVDFAGPWGAAVTATAPGTVVFAGVRGGYGNMVEIDHGFGVHTRYGHLSRIMVAMGAKVGKGSVVGRLGSTGRSTGPHVHYEVWYDNVVRNPSNFIEAGRHVL
ncbi:MAG TPA: peptidoglycan DD-metalloendopeptidase family protein [Rhizomicrobium sp.]|nr:peptidoglycan DD-metalloendopeptidase family protein [Rhizomicrobium sp.]